MKELSEKEKAKRYDEALKKAKGVIEQNPLMEYLKKGIEYILPELKENEDEKIKKSLSVYFAKFKPSDMWDADFSFGDIVAWLEKQGKNNMGISETAKQKLEDNLNKALEKETAESLNEFLDKQGEQEPINKAEPKFHEGEWINGYYTNYKVLSVNNDGYVVEDVDGNKINILFENERFHHLWIIEDAKDGDMLAVEPINDYPSPFIAIYKEHGLDYFNSYCFIGFDAKFYTGDTGHDIIGIHPATKEQRDTLMKAMTDAGYTFDFEKKELKKIVVPKFNVHDCVIKKHNSNINDFGSFVITDISGGKYWYNDRIICDIAEQDEWEIYEPVRQKPAWSEEDTQYINDTLALLSFGCSTHSVGEVKEWLQSLNNRVQPKQEWSEEDKRNLNDAILFIKTGTYSLDKDNLINWLKSLSPQPHWKPSDEQMNALSKGEDADYVWMKHTL